MEERHRDDGFEATFVVGVVRATAWDRLQSAAPAVDGLPTPRPGQWWIPGVEGPADPIEVGPWCPERRRRIVRVQLACSPCRTLEDPPCGEPDTPWRREPPLLPARESPGAP